MRVSFCVCVFLLKFLLKFLHQLQTCVGLGTPRSVRVRPAVFFWKSRPFLSGPAKKSAQTTSFLLVGSSCCLDRCHRFCCIASFAEVVSSHTGEEEGWRSRPWGVSAPTSALRVILSKNKHPAPAPLLSPLTRSVASRLLSRHPKFLHFPTSLGSQDPRVGFLR